MARRESAGERGGSGGEAELVEHARLQVVAELTEVTGCIACQLETSCKDLPRALGLAAFEVGQACVEHLRDRRQLLNGPVVDQLGDAATLLLLGEHALGEERSLGVVGRQSIIASRKRDCDRLRARVGFELREDVPHVALHRLLADEELRGDVGVRHPVREQLQDLALARGEDVGLALSGDELGHEAGIDERLTGCDLLDRAQERLVRRFLEDVAARTRLEPALEQRALAVRGEDEDARVRSLLEHLLGRLEAVHVRHAQIHDHHVRAASLRQRDGGRAVGRLADHSDSRRARQREAKPLADDLVVVGDEARDLVGHEAILRRGLG